MIDTPHRGGDGTDWSAYRIFVLERLRELTERMEAMREELEEVRHQPFGRHEHELLTRIAHEWQESKDDLEQLSEIIKRNEWSRWMRGLLISIAVGSGTIIGGIWAAKEPILWLWLRLFG